MGIKISQVQPKKAKKRWLWISIFTNIGFLGFFKYYNFFVESFAESLSNFGVQVNPWTLSIILPIGISFYTFHGLSYIIDVYQTRIEPEKNFIDYSVFVSFFPLLVAGPIERANHLLPQIKKGRTFDYLKAVDGLRQILWGLFKKVVIADNCAEYADIIFDDYAIYSGSTLLVGAIFFAFQIYCDFSGYSDIALGTARLFGIELLRNFAYPYFSRDIAEFWRRWHISLSSWFRDYLYVPLGGSMGSTRMKIRNTFAIFIVSGFWHGANWKFIAWGTLNAIYFLPLLLLNKNRRNLDIVAQGKLFPTLKEAINMCITFILTVFAWIFFRANSLMDAIIYTSKIFSMSFFTIPAIKPKTITMLIVFFAIVEWLGREQQYAIADLGLKCHRMLRWAAYYLIIVLILYFSGKEKQFIYFKF